VTARVSLHPIPDRLPHGGSLVGNLHVALDTPALLLRTELFLRWDASNPSRTTSREERRISLEPPLAPAAEFHLPFDIDAPPMPWSYRGRYVTVGWVVGWEIEVEGVGLMVGEVPLVVGPLGVG
jgi:hypothetical protein